MMEDFSLPPLSITLTFQKIKKNLKDYKYVEQHIKLPLVTLLPYIWMLVHVWAGPLVIHFPANEFGKSSLAHQREMVQVFGHLSPTWESWMKTLASSFSLVQFLWHLMGSEPVDGRPHFLFNFGFQSKYIKKKRERWSHTGLGWVINTLLLAF